ncbi:acylneuraminate cytidylyltransferase family protein [Flavobacteriaceae bacterium TK19130]|nr:acylneuraminate cytidylyltransferase family protein [Thermobacterium salinum]
MKVLGLIPARAGSKGIPQKNRKLLDGKPLLQYTLDSAVNANSLQKVVFSSEDSELQNLAKQFGASVPFTRPMELASDTATSLAVVQHALNTLQEQGETYDAVCLLQVTSPFRQSGVIDKAIQQFKEKGSDSLVSVLSVPHEYNPHWVFEPTAQGFLKIATGEDTIIGRRQDLPPAFIRDGSIYITKTEVILEQNSLYGNSIAYYPNDSKWHVNIDTPADWKRATSLAKKYNRECAG